MEACRLEGILESEITELLSIHLNKVQAKKRTEEYWEKVKAAEQATLFTSKSLMDYFLSVYEAKFGIPFVLDEYSMPVVKLLCQYFTNDPEFEKDERKLSKGILLFGNVGCGKSSIMQMFTRNQKQGYKKISCLEVAMEFTKNGYDGLMPYVKHGTKTQYISQNYNQTYLTWCFDDLGVEVEKKHYGNEVNVMEEVIQMIYDHRILMGNIHFTTNLTAKQIGEIYGTRVGSRLREMVNVIGFDLNSPDRRH